MTASGIVDIPVLHPNTPAELASAACTVHRYAQGPADERELLTMLGLDSGEADS